MPAETYFSRRDNIVFKQNFVKDLRERFDSIVNTFIKDYNRACMAHNSITGERYERTMQDILTLYFPLEPIHLFSKMIFMYKKK